MNQSEFYAKGFVLKRVLTVPLLFFAWFSPHKRLRVFFHRLRGVHIGRNVEIGYFCIIGNVRPDVIHIQDDVVITARCTILDHDNSYYYTHGLPVRTGDVVIERGSFIGIGSVIMPNVRIGESAIVGALSFVHFNLEAYGVYAGNPLRLLKKVNVVL